MILQSRGALRNVEGIASSISVVLALLALAAAPWPGLWSSGRFQTVGVWLVLWAALEGAFLLPLLPGLLSGTPAIVRATLRDGQISTAGRAMVWLAAGAGEALSAPTWRTIPAYSLVLVALAVALPVALGWGPFGAVPGLARSAAERSIDSAASVLVRRARFVRGLALSLAALALVLPLDAVSPVVAWPLLVGMLFLGAFGLRRLEGVWPRMTLQAALRFCWGRVLPLSVAAIIYVVILSWA